MSDPFEDFLSRWDGVDPLDSPASPARDLVLAAQFEDEIANGGLAQFLWNFFPRWEAVLDGAERAYRAMGAERQLAVLPKIRAVLRENAPLCAERIELAKNETEPGQAFLVWYGSAEKRMSLPSEELFYPDEPTLAAARLVYLEANRSALGDGPQGRARGKRPKKRTKIRRLVLGIAIGCVLFLNLPLPMVSVARDCSSQKLRYQSLVSGETNVRKVKKVLDGFFERNYVFAGMLWIRWPRLLDKELLWNYCMKAGLPFWTSDPAAPSPAEEPHAESAETAESVPHAESAEGAE